MRQLGVFLGNQLRKLVTPKQNGLLVCTPEDADFIAAGVMDALTPTVKELSFACYWHRRGRYGAAEQISLDLDVAPVIKRYEEITSPSLDFIVIVKSIISTACVVKHNILDVVDRKHPARIFVVAPVIFEGSDAALRADFPRAVSSKFHFIYFARDDRRDKNGIVLPGIGGDVYKRLGLRKRSGIPGLVKSRRDKVASKEKKNTSTAVVRRASSKRSSMPAPDVVSSGRLRQKPK
jgi:hypothetical protein